MFTEACDLRFPVQLFLFPLPSLHPIQTYPRLSQDERRQKCSLLFRLVTIDDFIPANERIQNPSQGYIYQFTIPPAKFSSLPSPPLPSSP